MKCPVEEWDGEGWFEFWTACDYTYRIGQVQACDAPGKADYMDYNRCCPEECPQLKRLTQRN